MTSTLKPPVELQAQAIEVGEIQNRINQIEGDIKALQHEFTKIRNGGHDIFQFGLPVDFVRKVTRDFPTDATLKLAADFELEHIRPLRQQLTDLKAKLNVEEVALGQLRSEFKSANADKLLTQTIERLNGAAADLSAAQAHHKSLEQRLQTARTVTLENERLQAAHDAVLAQALADGTEPPAKPEPQSVDSVTALQTALNLSRDKVKGLSEVWTAINAEVQHLRGIISNQKVSAFMVELKTMAATKGVKLAQVRDKLIESEGAALASLMDADELARLRFEVSTLRPEAEKLRGDVKILQNAILQASKKYA